VLSNSRKSGVLVFKTNTPYKIPVNGEQQERNVLICHDIVYQVEGVAFDLEQYFNAAMFDVYDRKTKEADLNAKDDGKQSDFFAKESPSSEEIEEQAMSLEMIIRMNKSIKLSNIMETFEKIVEAGLIESDTGLRLNIYNYRDINRIDKLRLVLSYCAFFVNPLQRLSAMGSTMEKKQLSDQTTGKKTQ
jgi:hypothetical protein